MSLIISLLQRSGSLENPIIPITAENLEASLGMKTDCGETVTHDRALKHSPVFRAVNLISTCVGKLPLFVYRRDKKGKDRASDHPAYNLLRYKPNEFMTAKIFKETMQHHVLMRGNAYAYIFRDKNFQPVEILPLSPFSTYPVRANGQLWYITKVNNEERRLYPFDVIHLRGLGFDGLLGYDVISYAKESIGYGLATLKYSSTYFKNSARPATLLEHPASLGQETINRLKNQWDSMYSGLDNSHKTAILEEGMKAHALSFSAKDSQLIESMNYNIKDISNWFGVPPHKLGDNTRAAYNSIESENQSLLDDCIDSWLVTWEEECRDKLLTEDEKKTDSHIIEFMRQALVRADMNTRGAFYKNAVGTAPWLTINEIRSMENLNPIEDGDKLQFPTNNFSQAGQKASERMLQDTKTRVLKRLKIHFDKQKDPAKLEEEHRRTCLEMLSPAIELHNAIFSGDIDACNIYKDLITEVCNEQS